MDTPFFEDSTVIARPPEVVYEMIADITRMGEWSPVCRACWWDEGAGPAVGAWFTGRNELGERTWETRSQVVAAEPGKHFAFVVGGSRVRWSYSLAPVEGGTRVTESWEFLPDGLATFDERYGDDAAAQVADRLETARRGIPATLAAIKSAAESS
jgi:hypothetical protein